MKKSKWTIDINLMNGNQVHYHFSVSPEDFDLLREATAEAILGHLLPDWMVSDLEEPLDKMLLLSDEYLSKKVEDKMNE